jgi:regulator of sigma E protease
VLEILSLIVVISVLVLVHEFGHFFAAKAVGIAAPRFSLGLGPRVAGFHVGETEFVLSAIPLGGYVKMAGMEDDAAAEGLEGGAPADPPVDPSRTFDAKPLWARVFVITAGVIMNILFAIVVYTVTPLIYGETVLQTVRVAPPPSGAAGVPAKPLETVPFGAAILSVGGKPVQNWNDVNDRLSDAPAGPVELRLDRGGPVTLDVPGGQADRLTLLNAVRPLIPPVAGQVLAGEPAFRAGLRTGDSIVAVSGKPARTWYEVVDGIQASPKRPMRMDVVRGGRVLALTIVPRSQQETDGEGRPVQVGKIGVGPRPLPQGHRAVGFAEAAHQGVTRTWDGAQYIAGTLRKLVTGQISPRSMGGLLSIGEASGDSARLGLEVFLGFLGFFSINLAVLNILPIPILDGGHLMFLAIEAIRGRPLSVEARIRMSHVGLFIVVALMLWANGNDILRRFGI